LKGTRPGITPCCVNPGGLEECGQSRSCPVVSVKRRRFPVEIILLCVRWYCKYGISYRDLAEMMQERGVNVDPSTIFRWVQRYAPEIEKRVRRYQGYRSGSWRVDETYVRVGGKWKYLFRAVDKHGQLIDFMLSDRRNTRAAYRFLRKALRTMSDHPPSSITTDKRASYPKAIQRLQKEGLLSKDVMQRRSKYLNNIIEADHGALKRVIRPIRGFQRMATASAAIKGFEVMRMIRRGHCGLAQRDVTGEIRLVNQLFGLAA
jgi:transposase, IS6 family